MRKIVQVDEKLPLSQAIPLSFQHLFAMFGASVLVPTIFGIDPAIVLLMNGIGTLLFMFLTKGKSPAYLGSSFAFIAPALLIINNDSLGYPYALGGFFVSGLIFCLFAYIIKIFGVKWIDVVLPPAAMGPAVTLIGLELAGVAAESGGLVLTETYTQIDIKIVSVFVITLLIAVIAATSLKGFLGAIPILISIIAGYVIAACVGLVDFSAVSKAPLLALPQFQLPKFDINSIIIIIPATLVVLSEHIGHQIVTGKIVGRDLVKDPGLHKTLLGDGISTTLSAIFGSVPTTTYGENIGVMAITRVYSCYVIGGAAVISIFIAFIGKISSAISSIPAPVMGGVSFLLYGMIATSGIRLMVEAKIDFSKSKNLVLTSVVFITGLSGAFIEMGSVKLSGMALATVVGMLLSLMMYIFEKLGFNNDSAE